MNLQKILPPVWFLISIVSMVSLHRWLPIKQLFSAPINNIGIVSIAIGIIIILFCAYLFKSKQTTIEPLKQSSFLITEGIFKYSRNPIYLGMIMILLGFWMRLGSLTPLFIIPIFISLIQELFIKAEETMLLDKFGEEYQAYTARVRRWI